MSCGTATGNTDYCYVQCYNNSNYEKCMTTNFDNFNKIVNNDLMVYKLLASSDTNAITTATTGYTGTLDKDANLNTLLAAAAKTDITNNYPVYTSDVTNFIGWQQEDITNTQNNTPTASSSLLSDKTALYNQQYVITISMIIGCIILIYMFIYLYKKPKHI